MILVTYSESDDSLKFHLKKLQNMCINGENLLQIKHKLGNTSIRLFYNQLRNKIKVTAQRHDTLYAHIFLYPFIHTMTRFSFVHAKKRSTLL